MQLFWRQRNNSRQFTLIVFNAVIRSKLLYGLGSAPLNKQLQDGLDVFHFQGLRDIFGIPTTYVDRTCTNEYVYATATQQYHSTVHKLSVEYNFEVLQTLLPLLQEDGDPTPRHLTYAENRQPVVPPLRTQGGPKRAWLDFALTIF